MKVKPEIKLRNQIKIMKLKNANKIQDKVKKTNKK